MHNPTIQRSNDPTIQRSNDPTIQRSNDPTLSGQINKIQALAVSALVMVVGVAIYLVVDRVFGQNTSLVARFSDLGSAETSSVQKLGLSSDSSAKLIPASGDLVVRGEAKDLVDFASFNQRWLAATKQRQFPKIECDLALDFKKRIQDRFLPSDESASLSVWVHLMRLSNTISSQSYQKQTIRAVDLLTDGGLADAYFGRQLFQKTPYGCRVVSVDPRSPTAEIHRDQLLATFAEVGIPLDQQVRFRSEMENSQTIRGLLDDSIANFHLNQLELSWTAFAYGVYLTDCLEVKNKFDENFTFDQITDKLLTTSSVGLSCGGTHLFSSLAALSCIDRECRPLFGVSTRRKLKGHLDAVLASIIENQRFDGGWDSSWDGHDHSNNDFSGKQSDSVITSHIIEILLSAAGDKPIPIQLFESASRFLTQQLFQELENLGEKRVCSVSHAFNALTMLERAEMN